MIGKIFFTQRYAKISCASVVWIPCPQWWHAFYQTSPAIHIIRQEDWKIGLLKKLRLVTVPPPPRATCGRPTSPRRLERRLGIAHSPGGGERSIVQSVPVDRPKSDGRRPHKARSGCGPTNDMIGPDRGQNCVNLGGGGQGTLHSLQSVVSESDSKAVRRSSPFS